MIETVKSVMLADGRTVKLGRIRPTKSPECLCLRSYLHSENATASPPQEVDWHTKAAAAIKRVYLNDQYGDCVIAGKYHQIGLWSANKSGSPVLATDQEVYQQYQSICGPGDNGCVITDVLDVFRNSGLPAAGVRHKIDGYVAVDWTNKLEVMTAVYLFGSLSLGINLPGDWTCTNCTWGKTNSQIVGGHDVCVIGYTTAGVQIATWGGIVTITWEAFLSHQWIEEAYAQLSPDWYGNDQLSPLGIDVATLKADLEALGHGNIPPIPDPVPPPGPGPVPPGPSPVPPTPVPGGPVLTLELTGSFPTGFGGRHETVKITGVAKEVVNAKSTCGCTEASAPINVLVIILDAINLYQAVRAKDQAAILAAISKLMADLGLGG